MHHHGGAGRLLRQRGGQLIYTAQLTVRAGNVATAVSRATLIVTGAGGYVSAENASSDPNHPAQSTAIIGAIAPFGAVLAALGALGYWWRRRFTARARGGGPASGG
jgi:hypothetical protein